MMKKQINVNQEEETMKKDSLVKVQECHKVVVKGIDFNIVKNIINQNIELEFQHIEADREYKELEQSVEYEKISNRCQEILKTICDNLPEELNYLVDEFSCKSTDLLCLAIRYYFKQGVISGLTGLKFLEQIGDSIIAI